jgi:thiol-disulfide isomerase/thioredoxin
LLTRLLLGFCLCLPIWAHADGVAVGQAAPPVRLPQLSGAGEFSLDSLRGKVVYVDFWASWCGPCRISFPILNQLRAELGAAGFEVLAVNLDEVESDAAKFLAEVPADFIIVRDAQGVTPKTYGLLGMPTGYLIDKQGIVREIHQGFRKSDGAPLRASIVALQGEGSS